MYYYTVVTPHTLQAAPCCVRMVAHQIWIVQCATAQWVSLGKRALQTLMSVTILTVVWVAQHVEMNLVDTGVNVHQALLGRIVERISMSASIIHAWTEEYAQMKLVVSVAIAQMATSGKRVGMWNHVFGTAPTLEQTLASLVTAQDVHNWCFQQYHSCSLLSARAYISTRINTLLTTRYT